MSYFTNYLAKRRQQGLPLVPLPTQQQPLKPELVQIQQPVQQEQRQQLQIDTSNAIGSLAEALGPTPAEREARQQRMERNRQQMQMWGGLFNGLRQLGNLYYTARGARPQRMEAPSDFINQEADRRQRLQDDMDAYRQRYAMQLYTLQRQQAGEARRAKLAEAQATWYDTRGEMARQKAELEAIRAENKRLKDQADLEEKTRHNKESEQISRNRVNKTGNAGSSSNRRKTGKGTSAKRGSLLPGGNGNNTRTRGSLLP